jgi:hypothetical protein
VARDCEMLCMYVRLFLLLDLFWNIELTNHFHYVPSLRVLEAFLPLLIHGIVPGHMQNLMLSF